MFHSIGLYGKREIHQANKKAEQLMAQGEPNVHIEIVWTEFNIKTLGPYLGFYVNYGEHDAVEPIA